MSALTIVYDPSVAYDDYAIVAPGTLAMAVVWIALLVIVLGVIGAVLDNHLRIG